MNNLLLPHYILTSISDPQGRGNASLLIDHTNKKIILEEIEVKAEYRGMSLGSRLLSQVCWLADSLGFVVVLVPVSLDDPVFTKCLTVWQLGEWYERYGFKLRADYLDGYPYLREPKKEMIDKIKLRELFDAEFERQKEFIAGLFLMGERERLNIFNWFCIGFQSSYSPPLSLKVADPLTPKKREALLKQLKDFRLNSYIVVEPANKLIFVYSWRSAQQRTMIILADSREEADSIFYLQFEDDTDLPTYYVTQLFVDGSESTIIYNN